MDVNEELKFLGKLKKKWGGGGGGVGVGWGGRGGCERRIEVFGGKIWGEGVGSRGQVGVGLVRVRVDVSEEFKFL